MHKCIQTTPVRCMSSHGLALYHTLSATVYVPRRLQAHSQQHGVPILGSSMQAASHNIVETVRDMYIQTTGYMFPEC